METISDVAYRIAKNKKQLFFFAGQVKDLLPEIEKKIEDLYEMEYMNQEDYLADGE